MKIMQGDSYVVPVELKQDGNILSAEMVAELEICVGEALRKRASADEVWFDEGQQKWYFRPTQAETLAMDPDTYSVIARVKYKNNPADVIGVECGRITIVETNSKEVI